METLELNLRDLDDGLKSNFWKAFMEMLKISIVEQEDLMSSSDNIVNIHRCQGRREVLKDLILWPEVQIEAINADIEFEETKKEKK